MTVSDLTPSNFAAFLGASIKAKLGCIISSLAISIIAALLSWPGQALSDVSQNAFHWQQGQWFSYPLEYRTPQVAEADVPLVTSRRAMSKALAEGSNRTGFRSDGVYDPTLLTDAEATLAFAFHLGDLRPVSRDLFFKPDFLTGGSVVRAEMIWAGPLDPSQDAVRPFEAAQTRGAQPAPAGEGRLAAYEDVALEENSVLIDFRIYEVAGPLRAILRCNVADEDGGGQVFQPLCDGSVWDEETNTVLYLTFPADLAAAPNGWIVPARRALQLAASWRMKDQ